MAELQAKDSALETVYRLGYALDALNYPDLAELFYPDKKFNFDIFAILKKPAQDVTLPEYFQIASGGLGGFDATQHVLTNPIITIDDSGRAHVKVMVTALHGLVVDTGVESATARVTWNIDLEQNSGKWFIVKWVIKGLVPVDNPKVFEQGHKRAHDGKLRSSIVGPQGAEK